MKHRTRPPIRSEKACAPWVCLFEGIPCLMVSGKPKGRPKSIWGVQPHKRQKRDMATGGRARPGADPNPDPGQADVQATWPQSQTNPLLVDSKDGQRSSQRLLGLVQDTPMCCFVKIIPAGNPQKMGSESCCVQTLRWTPSMVLLLTPPV